MYDSELALVYYNYRHYNPEDGRWINRDPIGIQGGLNLYAFIGNMVWLWDVLGKETCVNINLGPLEWPAAVGSLNVGFGSIDWSTGLSISVCWDTESVSGTAGFTAEIGFTLGLAVRKNIKGFTLFGMLGLRAFFSGSAKAEVTGEVDPKTCKPNFSLSPSVKFTIGLEGGLILRLSRKNKLLTELGVGARASISGTITGKVSCIAEDCQRSIKIEIGNTVDYSVFANFGWFDLSYGDSLDVGGYEKEMGPNKFALPQLA